MVVWTTGGVSVAEILARRFNVQGQALAEPFVLRSATGSEVSVAAAPGGDFLAAWSERGSKPATRSGRGASTPPRTHGERSSG